MSETKSICLRFNLDRPLDKNAWELLHSNNAESKSYSYLIKAAIVAYFSKCDENKYEALTENIEATVQRSIEASMHELAQLIGAARQKDSLSEIFTKPEQPDDDLSEVDFDFLGF